MFVGRTRHTERLFSAVFLSLSVLIFLVETID